MSQTPMFKNIEIQMPTDEECRQSSLAWYSRIGSTLIDQWPDDVATLSVPTKFVPYNWDVFEEMFEPKSDFPSPAMQELGRELDAVLKWDRHFVRLNSRSPKDNPYPWEVMATVSGKEALLMFCGSERALDDLCRFRWIKEHPALICLREWQWGLQPSQEYRCFVKDGSLIAATHYDYHNLAHIPEDAGKALRSTIDAWFETKLKPALHTQTVVFDIWVKRDGDILLIELNPYGLSDPCHFRSYDNVENASSFVQFTTVTEVAA